jgi:hypothetical protein
MTTPNLTLPELVANQSQPHVPLNTALRYLDALTQLAIIDRVAAVPASSPEPADGACYIVTGSPHTDQVAAWVDGAWAYFTPKVGWLAWVIDEKKLYVYHGSGSPTGWHAIVDV